MDDKKVLYAPWRVHYEGLAPVRDEPAEGYEEHESVAISETDAAADDSVDTKAQEFPIIMLFEKKTDRVAEFDEEDPAPAGVLHARSPLQHPSPGMCSAHSVDTPVKARDADPTMTKAGVLDNLDTIARPGTEAFVEAINADAEVCMFMLFEVGVHSAYHVAGKVVVTTMHDDSISKAGFRGLHKALTDDRELCGSRRLMKCAMIASDRMTNSWLVCKGLGGLNITDHPLLVEKDGVHGSGTERDKAIVYEEKNKILVFLNLVRSVLLGSRGGTRVLGLKKNVMAEFPNTDGLVDRDARAAFLACVLKTTYNHGEFGLHVVNNHYILQPPNMQ